MMLPILPHGDKKNIKLDARKQLVNRFWLSMDLPSKNVLKMCYGYCICLSGFAERCQ